MIQSILDTDLYKITMQHAVWHKFRDAKVKYQFINRSSIKFNRKMYEELILQIYGHFPQLKITKDEIAFLKNKLPYLTDDYLDYLKTYQFKFHELKFTFDEKNINITIQGDWLSTILWEVPLMALISELYFIHCDTNWNMEGQKELAFEKGQKLSQCSFADYGTRRRRSFDVQDLVVQELAKSPGFIGTSNIYLAKKHNFNVVGTMAHEWILGCAGLYGVENANFVAMSKWQEVYADQLGVALTDTFTTDFFLENVNNYILSSYEGFRQDSKDPIEWTRKLLNKFKDIGINGKNKKFIYSNALSVDTALGIYNQVKNDILPVFGIGTHLTNDFGLSKPLNMVIKMIEINGVKVSKISDDIEKACGDPLTIQMTLDSINKYMT